MEQQKERILIKEVKEEGEFDQYMKIRFEVFVDG